MIMDANDKHCTGPGGFFQSGVKSRGCLFDDLKYRKKKSII